MLSCLGIGFPNSSVGKESACSAGDSSSNPGSGRSPGERIGYPLQYSGLENPKDYTVHGVTKSWTQLSDFQSLSLLYKASPKAWKSCPNIYPIIWEGTITATLKLVQWPHPIPSRITTQRTRVGVVSVYLVNIPHCPLWKSRFHWSARYLGLLKKVGGTVLSVFILPQTLKGSYICPLRG